MYLFQFIVNHYITINVQKNKKTAGFELLQTYEKLCILTMLTDCQVNIKIYYIKLNIYVIMKLFKVP